MFFRPDQRYVEGFFDKFLHKSNIEVSFIILQIITLAFILGAFTNFFPMGIDLLGDVKGNILAYSSLVIVFLLFFSKIYILSEIYEHMELIKSLNNSTYSRKLRDYELLDEFLEKKVNKEINLIFIKLSKRDVLIPIYIFSIFLLIIFIILINMSYGISKNKLNFINFNFYIYALIIALVIEINFFQKIFKLYKYYKRFYKSF